MKRLIILSENCVHCLNVFSTIVNDQSLQNVMEKLDIHLVFYNKYLENHEYIMRSVVEWAKKNIDVEFFGEAEKVVPVFIQQEEDSTISVIQMGADGIIEALKDLKKIA